MEFFRGEISNCRDVDIPTHADIEQINGAYGVNKGEVKIYNKHFVYFDIDNVSFEHNKNNPFSNGDKVVLFASPTKQKYYKVESIKNLTRNFFIAKSYRDAIELFIKAIICIALAFCFICNFYFDRNHYMFAIFGFVLIMCSIGLLYESMQKYKEIQHINSVIENCGYVVVNDCDTNLIPQ